MQQEIKVPAGLRRKAERLFGENNAHESLRYLARSKTSISFVKGDLDSYLIVSGIVRSNLIHECKIVYKKRLEKAPEGPLKSGCNCQLWSEGGHCPHTAGLYLSYLIQRKEAERRPRAGGGDQVPAGRSRGVHAHRYGTLVEGPDKLKGAAGTETYTSHRYLLASGRVIDFPIPETFSGTLTLHIDHPPEGTEARFTHQDEEGASHERISLFENLYVFNWTTGQAHYLPNTARDLIERLRFRSVVETDELIKLYQKLDRPGNVRLAIDGMPFEEIGEERMRFRLSLIPDRKRNLVNMNFFFFDSSERVVPAPEFLRFMTFSGGLLRSFRKKRDAYQFIAALHQSVLNGTDEYKRTIHLSSEKERWLSCIDFVRTHKTSTQYCTASRKRLSMDNSLILKIFATLHRCFGDMIFRYGSYSEKAGQLTYKVSSSGLFSGLGGFQKELKETKMAISYNKKPVSSWTSKIFFERKSSVTKWFDLKLNVTLDDLEVIKKADLETGVILTSKELIILTQDQRELLKLLKRYVQRESPEDEEDDGGPKERKAKRFHLFLTRSKIFELFEMKRLGLDGVLTKEEEALCQCLIKLEGIPDYDVPPYMEDILRPYQRTGYNWLRFLHANNLGACLADDMGLGKTLQTIAFICSVIESIDRVLIVCPVSILLNWEKEFGKFSSLDIAVYHGGERRFPENAKIILTSYGIMRKEVEDTFADKYFDIIVLDEVQHLKNIRSLGSFAARKLNGGFRICLTGTPVENELAEFYNILDLSMPGTWEEFQISKNNKALQSHVYARKMANPFVLRRTKDQVLKELPPKQEQNVFLNFTKPERDHYEKTLKDIAKRVSFAPRHKKYGDILKGLLELRQRCLWQDGGEDIASTKIDFLVIQLEQILKENHQVIVFSQFTTYLDIIEGFFHRRGWDFARIDGTQSIKKRQGEVNAFQSGQKNIFLISLKAGGVGLNLTAASYVFLMDPWWNPAVEQQAIDRAHRIGQKNNLIVYKPIIKDSIEERVLKLKETKRELFENLLLKKDGGDFFTGKLSMKDFEHFFDSSL